MPHSGDLSRVNTFRNFAVSKQFVIVLSTKLSIEYGGVIINGRVVTLNNGHSKEMLEVASLSLARNYLSNSSFPNRHVDRVASINAVSTL